MAVTLAKFRNAYDEARETRREAPVLDDRDELAGDLDVALFADVVDEDDLDSIECVFGEPIELACSTTCAKNDQRLRQLLTSSLAGRIASQRAIRTSEVFINLGDYAIFADCL